LFALTYKNVIVVAADSRAWYLRGRNPSSLSQRHEKLPALQRQSILSYRRAFDWLL